MTSKSAFLVTERTKNSHGATLTATAVPIDVTEAHVLEDGGMFLCDGSRVLVEEITSDAAFGTVDRVWEEAANRTRLFTTNDFPGWELPAWLLPIPGLRTASHKVVVRLRNVCLFKSGYFQLACWSRLVWGTSFFGDPTTPKEHLKLAESLVPNVGDTLPVTSENCNCGVLRLEKMLSNSDFEATIFLLRDGGLAPPAELYLNAKMSCEDIEASFSCKIGTLMEILDSSCQENALP